MAKVKKIRETKARYRLDLSEREAQMIADFLGNVVDGDKHCVAVSDALYAVLPEPEVTHRILGRVPGEQVWTPIWLKREKD